MAGSGVTGIASNKPTIPAMTGPAATPAPPPPTLSDPVVAAAAQDASQDQRKAAARGQAANILTSGRGIKDDTFVSTRKQLLGS